MSNRAYDDDQYWAVYKHFLPKDDSPARSTAELSGIVNLLELPATNEASILDLGCGTGRHSLGLARQGFQITGVDRTQDYIDQCNRKAASEGLAIKFICQDMRVYQAERPFDAVICLFNPVGSFGSTNADLQLLRNIRRSLREGGRLIIDVVGKEIIARDFKPSVEYATTVSSQRITMYEKRRVLNDWSSIEYDRTFKTGATSSTFSMTVGLYSGTEFRGLIEEAGFSNVRLFGNHGGAPYDHKATRLVAVAPA